MCTAHVDPLDTQLTVLIQHVALFKGLVAFVTNQNNLAVFRINS